MKALQAAHLKLNDFDKSMVELIMEQLGHLQQLRHVKGLE
jgi:hypothetical protein